MKIVALLQVSGSLLTDMFVVDICAELEVALREVTRLPRRPKCQSWKIFVIPNWIFMHTSSTLEPFVRLGQMWIVAVIHDCLFGTILKNHVEQGCSIIEQRNSIEN